MEEKYYLTKVEYFDGKIKETFFCGERQKSRLLNFKPYFIHNLDFELVKKLSAGQNVLCLENKVFSKDFAELKKFHELLRQTTTYNGILLEPERQWLSLQGYSYFDAFDENLKFLGFNDLGKFPGQDLEFYDLAKSMKSSERKLFFSKIVLSNLLKVSPKEELEDFGIEFLKNFYFANDCILDSRIYIKQEELEGIKGFNEIELLDEALENLKSWGRGRFDVIIAEIEFKQDGIFLESYSPSYALAKHKERKMAKERIRYMIRNQLNSLPLGPFFSGERTEVLLDDLERLDYDYYKVFKERVFDGGVLYNLSKLFEELERKKEGIKRNPELYITYDSIFKNLRKKTLETIIRLPEGLALEIAFNKEIEKLRKNGTVQVINSRVFVKPK
jgi:hypothetical protein